MSCVSFVSTMCCGESSKLSPVSLVSPESGRWVHQSGESKESSKSSESSESGDSGFNWEGLMLVSRKLTLSSVYLSSKGYSDLHHYLLLPLWIFFCCT